MSSDDGLEDTRENTAAEAFPQVPVANSVKTKTGRWPLIQLCVHASVSCWLQVLILFE